MQPAPAASANDAAADMDNPDLVLAFSSPAAPKVAAQVAERQALLARMAQLGFRLAERRPTASQGGGGDCPFVLARAPFELLATYAEATRLEMPLANQPDTTDLDGLVVDPDSTDGGASCWKSVAAAPANSGDSRDMFTAPFQYARLDMFMHASDPDTFFSSAQRSLVAHSALCDLPEFSRCLATGSLTDCYPVHESGMRDELLRTWAPAALCWRFQPLPLVRQYLGEKIAMYFAWLGFYNMWLGPLALLGCLAFLYGLATAAGDATADDVCKDPRVAGMTLCPACDLACNYTKLGQSCIYSRLVRVFDNEATVLMSVLTSLWATCFLDFWRRRQAVLRFLWDVVDLRVEPTPRPEFVRRVQDRLVRGTQDEVQQLLEEGLPVKARVPRFFLSGATVLFMLCLVLAVVVGVIVYRLCILMVLVSLNTLPTSRARLITSLTAAVMNMVCISVLNLMYPRLALRLTDMELRRTDAGFENSYSLKVYCFQFVNNYASIFYIAFFKGQFHGRPGKYARLGSDARPEECDPAGCMVELVVQLLIVFIVKQLINMATEIGLPVVKKLLCRFWRTRRQPVSRSLPQWEADYALMPTKRMHLFDEYLEMVLQFGFLTLFVAAMPLAPLFALLNNIMELRLDAWKMLRLIRRPLAKRASDIGAWQQILSTLSAFSLVTNAVIVGFTSEQVPRLVYRLTASNGTMEGYIEWRLSSFNTADFEPGSRPPNSSEAVCYYRDFRMPSWPYHYRPEYWNVMAARLAFILVFEHLVLLLRGLVRRLVPDVPARVRREARREREIFRRALFGELPAAGRYRADAADEEELDVADYSGYLGAGKRREGLLS